MLSPEGNNPRENLQNRTGTDRPQKVENFQKTKAFKHFLTKLQNMHCKLV